MQGGQLTRTLEMTIMIRALNQTTGAFSGVRLAAMAAIGAIGAGLAYSVKQAADFQTGLTVLSTGAGETASALKQVGDGIKQISIDTGTSTDQLLKGMFMVESAGYRLANGGLEVLKVAAEGAKLENTDLGATAFALTGLLHDYGMATSQAGAAMSGLIQTEADGKMHMSDLTKALGNVLPLASSLKISFPQIGAAIAVMTNSNMSAMRATQNLNFLLRDLAAPTAAASSEWQVLGLSADQVKKTLQGPDGLLNALTLIEDAIGKRYPVSSAAYTTALKEAMGGAVGWNTALKLSGDHLKEMQVDISNISTAMQSGSTLSDKWAQIQHTFNFQMDQTKQALNIAAIDIGMILIPVLEKALAWVTPLIGQFTNWVQTSPAFQNAVNNVAAAIGNLTQFVVGLVQNAVGLYQAFQQGQGGASALAVALGTLGAAIALLKIEETVAGWYNWFQTMRAGSGIIANLIEQALPQLAKALGLTRAQADALRASLQATQAQAEAEAASFIEAAQAQQAEAEAALAEALDAAEAAAGLAAAAQASAQAALQAQISANAQRIVDENATEAQIMADMTEAAAQRAAIVAAEAAEEVRLVEQAAAEEIASLEATAATATASAASMTVAFGVATAGISILVGLIIAGIAQAAVSGKTAIQSASADVQATYNALGQSADDLKAKQQADAIEAQATATVSADQAARGWHGAQAQIAQDSANTKAKFILDQQAMADYAEKMAQQVDQAWQKASQTTDIVALLRASGWTWIEIKRYLAGSGTPTETRDIPGPHQQAHASGIMNSPFGHMATLAERGGEWMYIPSPTTGYVPKGASVFPHGMNPGGGTTININISTLAGSRAEVMRMVDLIEQELASRFRTQTNSFSLRGVS